jgi:DNA gyrase subunit A
LEVVTRRTRFELEKAEARLHILEGLLIAVANIDEVVKIIRGARNREDAAAALKSRFDLSDIQTSAILDMRLHQLTGLAIETLEREHREVSELVDRLKALLASREALLGVVRDELIEIRDKYGDERRTELTIDDSDINIADLIPRHSCVITVTNTGYLKRVPTAEFRTQHRGGKGVIGMETKDEDYVEHLFNADSHDIIFFITDRGVMHWLNVFEIPEGARTGKGKAIINMVKVQPGESIRAMLTVCKEDLERDDLFLTMATRKGIVKKTALSAFKNLRRAGIRALKIRDEDDLVEASVTTGDDEIILSTAKGLACRFAETDVRSMGRVASGVTGVKFKLDGDYVVGMAVVPSLPEDTDEDDGSTGVGPELLVVSNGGMGKRSFVSKYRKTRRGAKGVRNINLAEGESVVAALLVEPGDELIITTTLAQTVRIPVDEVRTVGRASKGVRIMRFKKDGDEITGVAKVVKVEADGDDGESSGEDAENADGGAVNANIAEAAAPGKENPSVEESGAEKKNTGDSEDSNPDESNA